MIEDRLLIWRFKHGSSDALSRIYKKYKDDLLKLASALLNQRSVAEDIVQDCFVFFAQSSDRLKLAGSLKGYLAVCVVNRVRNWNKAACRREVAVLNEAGPAVSNSKRPEQWIITNERSEQLNNALSQLPYQVNPAGFLVTSRLNTVGHPHFRRGPHKGRKSQRGEGALRSAF